MRKIRRTAWAAVVVFAMTCGFYDSDAAITFTLGHIYSTYTQSSVAGDEVYRNVVEYDANGTVLGSLVIPSLIPNDELRGIAFGPDGLLYAVKVHVGTPGFTVLVLNSSGAILRAYPMDGIYVFGNSAGGKITLDQQYIYVAGVPPHWDDRRTYTHIYSNSDTNADFNPYADGFSDADSNAHSMYRKVLTDTEA